MSRFPTFCRAVAGVVLLAALAGCKDSPTDIHSNSPSLRATCVPEGPRVACTATFFSDPTGLRDVTSQAIWVVSDPALGSFTSGIFTPRQRGEVVLSVRYQGFVDRLESRFLVDPAQPARRIYFLSGIVKDESSGAVLAGVTVEILDGYARGSRSVSNEFGHYQINGILTEEPFQVRASLPGYAPSTVSYRVDPPIGPAGGNSPFLDFSLRKQGP
ncbi:MAG TPA: carboxypeptidase-like regulatory domain-containing protein [Thermoanaerobaculia bacterium]|nr:carboxypeptidase-like regulatory domain-containing protein [Thermoanaerobaculia bacterium]